MFKLDDIGFYTLSDSRAAHASIRSPLWRCELILTDKCNFKCPYCRGVAPQLCGTMSESQSLKTIDTWLDDSLQNIRFSGGEPTLYPWLLRLVKHCQSVRRIAISTNGSARFGLYYDLIEMGVNDISVSLDACCAATGDQMAGNVLGAWKRTTDNIKELARLIYVTVGIVLTDVNIGQCRDTIMFASEVLGVADIRIIPAAQDSNSLQKIILPKSVTNRHPILKYRIERALRGESIRGISDIDNNRCPLVFDDMAVIGDFHYPCIIYLREQGRPIGKVGSNMRRERATWNDCHDTHKDSICRNNCLDVCIAYNNAVQRLAQSVLAI